MLQMKIQLYKILLIAFIALPLCSSANGNIIKGKHTKEKTIKKEYDVNADALLKISNSYGNLNITSWTEKNQFQRE